MLVASSSESITYCKLYGNFEHELLVYEAIWTYSAEYISAAIYFICDGLFQQGNFACLLFSISSPQFVSNL